MLPFNIKNKIVGLDTPIPLINNQMVIPVNFDNAASTPPFSSVLKKVVDFSSYYSSVHRGAGYKSSLSTEIFEDTRNIIKHFVNADLEKDTVIFTKNTTESINLLANILPNNRNDNVVLSTEMEHHSNDLPWRNRFTVDYIKIDKNGKLIIEDLEKKLKKHHKKVKLVTVTGASNVTGYINDIHTIADLVHGYGAELLVDGAQLIPHTTFDMKSHKSSQHIDYLAFSAHKMYAPFGIGVLIGPKKKLNDFPPFLVGGGTIECVTYDNVRWANTPSKHEGGSPNVIGVVALAEAIKELSNLDMLKIEQSENTLMNYALDKIRNIPNIKIYARHNSKDRKVGIIPFNIKGIYHATVARILSEQYGIAVRNGCFCAQPYVRRLLKISDKTCMGGRKTPGMVRASFGLYNDKREVDRFVSALKEITYRNDI